MITVTTLDVSTESSAAKVWNLFIKLGGATWFSILFDKPIRSVIAADEDVPKNICGSRVRRGDGTAVLENVHRRPGTSPAGALSKNPLACSRSGDDNIGVRISRNTPGLSGIIGADLIIVH